LSLGSGKILNGKGKQLVPKGETLFIRMPGGGGLGDPMLRDPALVAKDVRLGLVSAQAAKDHYGVTIADDGSASR
jgi:N-methylhydantoinase B